MSNSPRGLAHGRPTMLLRFAVVAVACGSSPAVGPGSGEEGDAPNPSTTGGPAPDLDTGGETVTRSTPTPNSEVGPTAGPTIDLPAVGTLPEGPSALSDRDDPAFPDPNRRHESDHLRWAPTRRNPGN